MTTLHLSVIERVPRNILKESRKQKWDIVVAENESGTTRMPVIPALFFWRARVPSSLLEPLRTYSTARLKRTFALQTARRRRSRYQQIFRRIRTSEGMAERAGLTVASLPVARRGAPGNRSRLLENTTVSLVLGAKDGIRVKGIAERAGLTRTLTSALLQLRCSRFPPSLAR